MLGLLLARIFLRFLPKLSFIRIKNARLFWLRRLIDFDRREREKWKRVRRQNTQKRSLRRIKRDEIYLSQTLKDSVSRDKRRAIVPPWPSLPVSSLKYLHSASSRFIVERRLCYASASFDSNELMSSLINYIMYYISKAKQQTARDGLNLIIIIRNF